MIGAPAYRGSGEHGGRAYVVGAAADGDVDLAAHSPVLTGEAPDRRAGTGLSGAGDIDGDGIDDLLVGDTADNTGGEQAGAAYLVFGPVVEDLDLADADAKLTAEVAHGEAGWMTASAGDLDGDGHTDLLVSAPYTHGELVSQGWVYVVHGPVAGHSSLATAEAILQGEDTADLAGFSIAGGTDVSGDGRPDILVGAPYAGHDDEESGGIVYLVTEPVSGSISLSSADVRLEGEAVSSSYAGVAVACVGDVDADGHPDILIGALDASWLVNGPISTDTTLAEAGLRLATAEASTFGIAVASGGDVDGDGIDDFWIGASSASTDHYGGGTAFLLYGGDRFRRP